MNIRFTPLESGLIAACIAVALVTLTSMIEAAIGMLTH